MVNIYPNYTMIFVLFNLLGWWFKGQPFINWWWFILIAGIEIIIQSLLLAITNKLTEFKK